MIIEFIQITQVSVHYFKSFNGVISTQNGKVLFIKGNDLKLIEVEVLSFFFFKECSSLPSLAMHATCTNYNNTFKKVQTILKSEKYYQKCSKEINLLYSRQFK